MKLLSAMFDTILIPLAIAADVITVLPRLSAGDDGPSYTRQQIERVEKDLTR